MVRKIAGVALMVLLSCSRLGEPAAERQADLSMASVTSQQLQYWQAWLDSRTPPAYVSGFLYDDSGQYWDCVDERA